MRTNEENWKFIDFNEDYSLGSVWTRFEALAKEDPYVGMLSEHVIRKLTEGITSPACLGTDDRLRVNERGQTEEGVKELVFAFLGKSPLSALLTPQFHAHIVSLVLRAMFPKAAMKARWDAYWHHLRNDHDDTMYIGDTVKEHAVCYPNCDWKPEV